ncbi:MAG: DUF2071 domain-containing protein [Bacteroidetes bacterium]|nr:DUF2071 domain-containing protein [Bacteroidota bacterium]
MKENKQSSTAILQETSHRPWPLSTEPWKFYQEWMHVLFLHWKVELQDLQPFVPKNLEIDLHDGNAWVSLVAFDMKHVCPRFLPAFPPVSNFHALNLRTYVRYQKKAGVYFLSIEASKLLSTWAAKWISRLPYRFSEMKRTIGYFNSFNKFTKERLSLRYELGNPISDKSDVDRWLTERYVLFQDTEEKINQYDIHHLQWPLRTAKILHLDLHYPGFKTLFQGEPTKVHYSPGVQVLAWDREDF